MVGWKSMSNSRVFTVAVCLFVMKCMWNSKTTLHICMSFFFADNSILKTIEGAHLDCVIKNHTVMVSMMHLLPENVLVSENENIPGLAASPTGKLHITGKVYGQIMFNTLLSNNRCSFKMLHITHVSRRNNNWKLAKINKQKWLKMASKRKNSMLCHKWELMYNPSVLGFSVEPQLTWSLPHSSKVHSSPAVCRLYSPQCCPSCIHLFVQYCMCSFQTRPKNLCLWKQSYVRCVFLSEVCIYCTEMGS